MRKISVLVFVIALNFALFADKVVGEGNSYSEFPFIIFVGQLVEITPFSVVFENTMYETATSTEKIGQLIQVFEKDKVENGGIKVLGEGDLNVKLTVQAAKFSASAAEKIEKAGGKAEVM